MNWKQLATTLALLSPLAALAVRAADNTGLKAGVVIELPGSAGKFDFLQVDAARHRLLAAHEKDDTFDLFDLTTSKLITRLKLGGVVDALADPETPRYF